MGQATRTAELKLMATGGWSEKIRENKRNSAGSAQASNREPTGPVSADQTVPSSRNAHGLAIPVPQLPLHLQ